MAASTISRDIRKDDYGKLEGYWSTEIGPLNQVEISVPVSWSEQPGGWNGGLGDIALGYKRVLTRSLSRGNIFSLTGEFVLPTGSESRGLGSGEVALAPSFSTWLDLGHWLTLSHPGPRRSAHQATANSSRR